MTNYVSIRSGATNGAVQFNGIDQIAFDGTTVSANIFTVNGKLTTADGSTKVSGEIFKFAGPTPPAGSLACPTVTTNISRTTYANLFAAIGTYWGAGDGSTTFGMPYFPTGYSGVQGTPGIGTVGAVISHNHIEGGGNFLSSDHYGLAGGLSSVYGPNSGGATTQSAYVSTTGAAANFAAGMGVQFCVKY